MFKKVIVSPLGELTQDTRTVGDRIRYRIYYNDSKVPAGIQVTLTDVVDKSLTRVKVFNNGKYASLTRTITWVVKSVSSRQSAYVEFEAVVSKKGRVTNQASAKGAGRLVVKTNIVEITVLAAPPLGWIPFQNDVKEGEPPRAYMKDETTMGTTVRFDIPGLFVYGEQVDGVTYQHLTIPARAALTEVGKPELPIVGEMIEVPFGVNLSPEIVQAETTQLTGYNVYPAQPPRIEGDPPPPPFTLDTGTYQKNANYPLAPVTIEGEDIAVIRGHRVLFLKVNPVQYNPVTRVTTVFKTIEVRLNFDHPAQLQGVEKRLRSRAFEELLQASLLNYKDPQRFFTEGVPDDKEKTGCDYLIITHDAFYTESDPNNPVLRLANWKRRKGYPTRVVKVGSIQGGNTANAIQTYIQNAYDTWSPAPSYVLLVGDADLVRAVEGATHPQENDPDTPQPRLETDLYYTTVDGDDYFPDIYIGRLSADTQQQVTDIVNKLLAYEQNPPATPANAGFYTDASLIGQFADNDGRVPFSVDGREDRPWIGNLETLRQFLQGEGYTVERIYITDSGFPGNPNGQAPLKYNDNTDLPNDLRSPNYGWNGGTGDISNAINNGRFLLTYRAHGSWNGWAGPSFNSANVANLNQNDRTPVIFSITCQTGWFDNETDDDAHGGRPAANDCFGEVLLRRPRAGAVSVVGMTRNSWTGWNDLLVFGLHKAIWPTFSPDPPWSGHPTIPAGTQMRLLRMGQIVNFSKMYMARAYSPGNTRLIEFEMQHLFGDPEMPLWIHAPGVLAVDRPKGIGATGLQEFVVKVVDKANGQVVQNATVVLTRGNAIVQVQQTQTDGLARFSINGVGSGDLDLTVTALGYRPYMDSLAVSASGAELNRLEPPDGPETQVIFVGGQGFKDGETVDIYFGDAGPTTVTADASGKFGQGTPTVNVTVPAGFPHGLVNVCAYGRGSLRYAVRVFQVRDKNPVDLWTYSQWDSSTWSLHPGDNPTWNSPDIQLYDANGNPVDSNNLVFGQTYTVKVNVRNKTAFPAQKAQVVFQWRDYGADGPWELLDTRSVDVPANPPGLTTAQTDFPPPGTGHLCLRVNLEHIEDTNPANNSGQENLHVGYTSSPAEVCFMVWNLTKEPAPVHIEVRQLLNPKETKERLWASWVKHPDPQILQPGDRAQACVIVDPDKADVGSGTTAEFAVTAFIGNKMIGGVNLIITKK